MSKTKVCTKCNKEKFFSSFFKDKSRKDGLQPYCKKCFKDHYLENKEQIKQYKKEYQTKNKEKISLQKKEHHKKYPWKETLSGIKQRCNNPNNEDYKYYGGKGIKCLITSEELKELWFRDKAYLMKKPSIDREENDGNYEYENCRFIELRENIGKDKRKPILQLNLDGNFIKEWPSAMEIEQELGFSNTSIGSCASGKSKSAYRFKWKYKNEHK